MARSDQSQVPHDPNMLPEVRDFLDGLARYQVRVNDAATSAPLVTDDETKGYQIRSGWIDQAADAQYVCLDATTGAAVWKKTTP